MARWRNEQCLWRIGLAFEVLGYVVSQGTGAEPEIADEYGESAGGFFLFEALEEKIETDVVCFAKAFEPRLAAFNATARGQPISVPELRN